MSEKKLVNYLKDLIGPKYYKLFPKNFGKGYERYKKSLIIKKINKQTVHTNQKFIDERIIEIPWVINELRKLKGNLLDAGSTLNFNYLLEKLIKKFNIYIVTLYPEKNNYNNFGVSYIYEDFVNLSFKNNFFDVITCISTIEHVGFDNSIYINNKKINKKDLNFKKKHLIVLKKLVDVLKPGGKMFLTIPYGKKGIYKNLQQFDKNSLNNLLKNLKVKKIYKTYYAFINNNWIKVNSNNCKNIKPLFIYEKKHKKALASNSIALIKIIK